MSTYKEFHDARAALEFAINAAEASTSSGIIKKVFTRKPQSIATPSALFCELFIRRVDSLIRTEGEYNTLHEWEKENPQEGNSLTLVLREMLRKCGEQKVNMQTYVVCTFSQLRQQ